LWTKVNPYQIIIKPLYTEKSVKQAEDLHKYCFKVHSDANKIDIKNAVEHIYNVDVWSVNVAVVPTKWRSVRALVRKWYKKAIVTLKNDQKIELV